MENIKIDINYRLVKKDDNSTDIFIDCDEKVVLIEDDSSNFFYSRIQFPKVRMILIRVSDISDVITVHILKDIDLFSACSNFEVKLSNEKLWIFEEDGLVKIRKK